jgi:hypothetical protein
MYQNQAMSTKLLEKNHIAPYMYANNPRMIPQGTDPRCHRMFITVPTEVKEEENKKKQRQQDIRKLLGGPSGRKVTGKHPSWPLSTDSFHIPYLLEYSRHVCDCNRNKEHDIQTSRRCVLFLYT